MIKILLGIIFIFVGTILAIISLAPEIHFAGLILIGPIPIIISSSDFLLFLPLFLLIPLILIFLLLR